MAVTPVPGLVSTVLVGGVSVIVVPAGPNGGFIQNPSLAADQGLATAEALTVNPVGPAGVGGYGGLGQGNGTNFVLPPGGTWEMIPGQTTATSVNCTTNGHKFSVVWY
jgi:hypothetical protein